MGLSDRVKESVTAFRSGNVEQAFISACIAVDKTAKLERPTEKKNNRRYKAFLADNIDIIGAATFGVAIPPTTDLRFPCAFRNIKPDQNGYCSLIDILYHAVRCGLLHEAELPKEITFVPNRLEVQTTRLVLPTQMLVGLIAAVVTSKKNARKSLPTDLKFVSGTGARAPVNDFWGKKVQLIRFLTQGGSQ